MASYLAPARPQLTGVSLGPHLHDMEKKHVMALGLPSDTTHNLHQASTSRTRRAIGTERECVCLCLCPAGILLHFSRRPPWSSRGTHGRSEPVHGQVRLEHTTTGDYRSIDRRELRTSFRGQCPPVGRVTRHGSVANDVAPPNVLLVTVTFSSRDVSRQPLGRESLRCQGFVLGCGPRRSRRSFPNCRAREDPRDERCQQCPLW